MAVTTFGWWRQVHRLGSGVLGALAILQIALAFAVYRSWSPESVWFMGTGLGLLLLAAANWSHVGVRPCELPTAVVVLWANVLFVVFGIAAVSAMPELRVVAVLAALVVQAAASVVTLRPGRFAG